MQSCISGFNCVSFSFPLDRRLPFSQFTRFDALFLWAFIALLFTIAAFIVLARRPERREIPLLLKMATWLGVVLVAFINLFLIVGFLAAAYY